MDVVSENVPCNTGFTQMHKKTDFDLPHNNTSQYKKNQLTVDNTLKDFRTHCQSGTKTIQN